MLGEMVRSFAQGLMSAEADVAWGERSPDRVNRRNRYRTRRWDTRVGSIELRTPEAANRFVLPRMVAGRPYPKRAGVCASSHRGLCSGDLYEAGGGPGRSARGYVFVQVPGVRTSAGSGPDSVGVP